MDNLRSLVVLLVVLCHAVCVFSSCGVTLNVHADGVPALDAVGYLLYPWLMPCLFLLAGVAARYALEGRTARQFLRNRCRKLLLPLAGALACLGPPLVGLTFAAMGGTVGEMIAAFPAPGIALFFLALMGMGPQWFLLELFLFSLVLLAVRRLDRGGRLSALGARAGPVALAALWLPFQAGSALGNLANRELLNLIMLLLGYFVFAHAGVQERLRRAAPALLLAALALFAGVLARFFGTPFTAPAFLSSPLATAFGWCATLAALGCALRWLHGAGPVSAFWRTRSFAVYQFHFLPMMGTAWLVTRTLPLPVGAAYLPTLLLPLAAALLLFEGLRRVPGLRTLFALPKP